MIPRRLSIHSFALAALAVGCGLPNLLRASNEVGFIERFALASDRVQVLGELVPGSEDYYYFHCLHYQSSGNPSKFKEFIAQWRMRFPEESRSRRLIENRQALIDYDATPQQTLDYLKRQLNVTHRHQQEVRNSSPNLPTALDPTSLNRDVFEREALAHDAALVGVSQDALETMVRNKAALNPQQRRSLLAKLVRPDVPNLTALIIADLKSPESHGFGEFALHRALLPPQLDALVEALPTLATDDAFVQTRLRKLAPSPDVDVAFDPAEREAWLDRLWAYARTLPPAFNTLKAQLLYQRLDHDRGKGVYDPSRFIEYLKLPRRLPYVNPNWLGKHAQLSESLCDLNADLSAGLAVHCPIGNDEPLVREYFLALFEQAAVTHPAALGESMLAPYTAYVLESWLKPLLAEALIVGGHGDAERWASLLNPSAFQTLKERVDIDFPATNPQIFLPGAAAQIEVVVKNTPTLIVKIYELNAQNIFLTQHRQLNTDLNLDGLVAHSEQTHSFEGGPFKRSRKTIAFPELMGRRGAWIVEFIGRGRSSRALLRVGQWQLIQRTGPAGDLLLVVDEHGEPVPDAVVWLDGRKFTRDDKLDRIVVPFTQQPGTRPVVLCDSAGSFATLSEFNHHAEDYQLDAQFHIEREQLLARRQATLAVRAVVRVGDARLDPALIIDPRLTITSTTVDGIATTREVNNLTLRADSVLTHTLNVPERLAQLDVTLTGKIESISGGGEPRALSASHRWTLNGIDKTAATYDGHMAKLGDSYVYELLGKNGEAVASQQVVFNFHHRGFTRPQTVALKSDALGRIALGALPGIASVHAQAPNGREARWPLDEAVRTWPSEIHAALGEVVRVPWSGGVPASGRLGRNAELAEISLLEIKAGTFTGDQSARLAINEGFLEITGLTAGDYSLRMRGDERDITLRVSAGKTTAGWLLGKHRNLEIKNNAPLQITGVTTDDASLTIKLANASVFTRVHVAASRFLPETGLFSGLGGFTRVGVAAGVPAKTPNLYSAGRQIGDEYRYILERRYSKHYPGNSLARPSILLNPWQIRDTGIDELTLENRQFAPATSGGKGGGVSSAKPDSPATPTAAGFDHAAGESNLDFLAASAPVIYNLLPDKNGIVRLDRSALGDRQQVQIYAEDLENAVCQTIALSEVPTQFTDQRLAHSLDLVQSFSQRKEVTVLAPGKTLEIEDIVASEMVTYDTLAGVHALFTTLTGDATMSQFAWVLQWPHLTGDEQRAKYSEFACHELNLFLARKDPAFFSKVIQPALANKIDKSFMDEYLLGIDLARYLLPTAYAKLNVGGFSLLANIS